jgi:pyruvate/2-oxoacid:ferredoxin oxidoreductase alpha subunit
MKKMMTGNTAVTYGVALSRPEVIAAYPITPQTTIIEELSEMCADGRCKAKFVRVESEHSVLACVAAASIAGARVFTATSSQGLAYMHEMLHWAAGSRLPVVMVNANRALGSPWNIWCDHSDSLSQRDTGWLQIYCESAQEALDTVIQAFRIAEAILLPVMVLLDGFVLTHTSEPVDVPEQTAVDNFLPPYHAKYKLDTEDPHCFNMIADPSTFVYLRHNAQKAMDEAKDIVARVDREFKAQFGRGYGVIEQVNCGDADVILVMMGTAAGTSREVIEDYRTRGHKIGLCRLRMFRPFPSAELVEALSGAKKIAVLDRDNSLGAGGIIAQELKAAFYSKSKKPKLFEFIAGIGGRDITPELIADMIEHTLNKKSPAGGSVWMGVQE